jgi:hypothetical protein
MDDVAHDARDILDSLGRSLKEVHSRNHADLPLSITD